MTNKFAFVAAITLSACTLLPKQDGGGCSVSIFQDGVQINGNYLPDDQTVLFELKKKPFTIKTAAATCNASIGVFGSLLEMRAVGVTKSKVFTTSGFEMSYSPELKNTLPTRRGAERIPSSDLNNFLGDEGVRNYQSVCKSDGKCPVVLGAFRSYQNFLDQKTDQSIDQATINLRNYQPISLVVYTEQKRFLSKSAMAANANWPADILLEPHPIVITFAK